MKPRTKHQRKVASLAKELQPITTTYALSVLARSYSPFYAHRTKSKIYCLKCGESWTNDGRKNKKLICPHCKEKLNAVSTLKRTRNDEYIVCITDVIDDIQIFRYIAVYISAKVAHTAEIRSQELYSLWLNSKGQIAVYGMIYNAYSGRFFGDDEIRPYHTKYGYSSYEFVPDVIEKPYKITRWLRKRGMTHFYDTYPVKSCLGFMYDSRIETLAKAKQRGLCERMINSYKAKEYFRTYCICIRNNYTVKRVEAQLYVDYLEMLERNGKDLRNAHYVCPENIREAHDRYVAIEQRKLEKERRERELQMLLRQKEKEESFIALKSKYFSLDIRNKDIRIVPLKSLAEFKKEADVMHHCVFANDYIAKKDSLILSATVKGKKMETIEVNLKSFTVVQCQGACNKNSQYHQQILQLMTDNINQVKRIAHENNSTNNRLPVRNSSNHSCCIRL